MPDEKKLLSRVSDDKLAFWFSSGDVVRSLQEMALILPKIKPDVFSYHVNPQKNDISSWIRGVFEDHALADSIKSEYSPIAMADKISKRILSFQKPIVPPSAPKPKISETKSKMASVSVAGSKPAKAEKKRLQVKRSKKK